MSYANTLFSTATQLAVGLGISLAAIGIRIGDVVSERLALGNIPGSVSGWPLSLLPLFVW
jgi:hypothetical protein